MRSRRLIQRAIPATVALAFALSGAAVFAQDSSSQEVKIQSTPVVTTDGYSRTGIQDQRMQLSRNISFADLNIATPAGADELKARVRDAANMICERLGNADPDSTAIAQQEDQNNCVNGAVDDAMTQVRRAMAARNR